MQKAQRCKRMTMVKTVQRESNGEVVEALKVDVSGVEAEECTNHTRD